MTIPAIIHSIFSLGGTARPSKHATMLSVAEVLAHRSTCARRRVGCVLVDAYGRILSTGNNGPARGQPHCSENTCPGACFASGQGLDKCEAIHAEQNALMFCNDIMEVHTAYVTASPCISCVKMLLNTSCMEVVFLQEYPHPEAKELWLRGAGRNRKWTKYEAAGKVAA